MRRVKLIFSMSLIVSLLFSSCKESGNSGNENNSQEVREIASTREIPIGDYEQMNMQAKSILEYRYKEQGKESYAAIEMDRWYYEYKAVGSDITRVEDGSYIDFYPDLTYEFGDQIGTISSGQYHYNPETGLVLLVDNNVRIKPREYEAKIVGPTMVFVGKSTYGDNFFQCKLAMDHVNRDQES